MKYCIQWIDHGGCYDHAMSDIDIHNALDRLGLSTDIVLGKGGVKVSSSEYSSEDFDHYWYIETSVELPSWNKGGNTYSMNLDKNMDRFDKEIKLWFYTFELNEEIVKEWFTLSEYDEMNGW